jgi:hypothetical protein
MASPLAVNKIASFPVTAIQGKTNNSGQGLISKDSSWTLEILSLPSPTASIPFSSRLRFPFTDKSSIGQVTLKIHFPRAQNTGFAPCFCSEHRIKIEERIVLLRTRRKA